MAYGRRSMTEDDFGDYDPTPYGGGYDMFVTFGRPVPPSEETCHPITIGDDHAAKDRPGRFEPRPSPYGHAGMREESKQGRERYQSSHVPVRPENVNEDRCDGRNRRGDDGDSSNYGYGNGRSRRGDEDGSRNKRSDIAMPPARQHGQLGGEHGYGREDGEEVRGDGYDRYRRKEGEGSEYEPPRYGEEDGLGYGGREAGRRREHGSRVSEGYGGRREKPEERRERPKYDEYGGNEGESYRRSGGGEEYSRRDDDARRETSRYGNYNAHVGEEEEGGGYRRATYQDDERPRYEQARWSKDEEDSDDEEKKSRRNQRRHGEYAYE